MSKIRKKITFVLAVLVMIGLLPLSALAKLPETDGDLDVYIRNEFEKTHIPDMSVEIVDADEVLFTGNYGNEVSADAPFILGSISKSFTALAIMQLAEQGKIDTDEAISSYLSNVEPSCKTTVRQLLNHTSGVHTNMTLENFKTSDKVEDYEYANVNYDLLGLIVENVSGLSFDEYIKQNIFEPLGMDNSYVSIDEAKAGGLIDGYRNYFGIMHKEEFDYPQNMTSGWMTLSAAYLISTANDMGKYLQFYLGGNEHVLASESMNRMFHDTVKVIENYEYGFGWGISRTHGVTMYLHGGNVENYTTYMVLLPDLGKGIIVLTNACDFFGANDMVVNLAENIGCKLSGVETADIDSGAYMETHSILNVVMLVIAVLSILPVVFLKKWFLSKKVSFWRIIKLFLIHAALPTLFLLVPAMLGSPMWVALRFAPDLAIVLIAGSGILYLTGIIKIVCLFRRVSFQKKDV